MLLAIYYIILFLAVFVWPSWRLWRRHGVNALALPRDDTAEGVIGRWFKALMIGVALTAGASAAGVGPHPAGALAWLDGEPGRASGWALLVISLGWMVGAQAQMGRAWRIGIDRDDTPFLARRGLFGRSRNPIFLGLRANLLGLLLVMPDAITLAVLLVAEALIQVQVRLEEAHLAARFGPTYADYRAAVPRWL